jgi:hypothetical protein
MVSCGARRHPPIRWKVLYMRLAEAFPYGTRFVILRVRSGTAITAISLMISSIFTRKISGA